jgi:hypothetical protein
MDHLLLQHPDHDRRRIGRSRIVVELIGKRHRRTFPLHDPLTLHVAESAGEKLYGEFAHGLLDDPQGAEVEHAHVVGEHLALLLEDPGIVAFLDDP